MQTPQMSSQFSKASRAFKSDRSAEAGAGRTGAAAATPLRGSGEEGNDAFRRFAAVWTGDVLFRLALEFFKCLFTDMAAVFV